MKLKWNVLFQGIFIRPMKLPSSNNALLINNLNQSILYRKRKWRPNQLFFSHQLILTTHCLFYTVTLSRRKVEDNVWFNLPLNILSNKTFGGGGGLSAIVISLRSWIISSEQACDILLGKNLIFAHFLEKCFYFHIYLNEESIIKYDLYFCCCLNKL